MGTEELITALAPRLLEVLPGVLGALGTLVVTWLRARAQRLVVQQATDEVEVESRGDPTMHGDVKRDRAIKLAAKRFGALTLPGTTRLEKLVDKASTESRRSLGPPPEEP